MTTMTHPDDTVRVLSHPDLLEQEANNWLEHMCFPSVAERNQYELLGPAGRGRQILEFDTSNLANAYFAILSEAGWSSRSAINVERLPQDQLGIAVADLTSGNYTGFSTANEFMAHGVVLKNPTRADFQQHLGRALAVLLLSQHTTDDTQENLTELTRVLSDFRLSYVNPLSLGALLLLKGGILVPTPRGVERLPVTLWLTPRGSTSEFLVAKAEVVLNGTTYASAPKAEYTASCLKDFVTNLKNLLWVGARVTAPSIIHSLTFKIAELYPKMNDETRQNLWTLVGPWWDAKEGIFHHTLPFIVTEAATVLLEQHEEWLELSHSEAD